MKRGGTALALLFLLVASAFGASTNPVLVLLEPAMAVPEAARGLYIEDAWVRWPRRDGATGNRLLSIASGLDWRGDVRDYRFRLVPPDAWRSENLERLRARGYFEAKRRALPAGVAMLALGPGRSRDALLLALDEAGPVKPIRLSESWPEGRLIVCQASGWNDIEAIQRATTGRVLVVEYPPLAEGDLSRAWLRGNAWPVGRTNLGGTKLPALPVYTSTGEVPGLIPAREVGRLLTTSAEPSWVSDPGQNWPGADRWLAYVEDVGRLVRGALGVAALALVLWGLRLVADERRSRAFCAGVGALALAIPVTLLAGAFVHPLGMGAQVVAFPLAGLAMGVTSVGVYTLSRRRLPLTHRWWPVAAVAVPALLIANPVFSAMSGPLDLLARPVSPEPLGLLLAGILVLVAGGRGEPGAKGFGRLMAAVATGLGLFAGVWWAEGNWLVALLPGLIAIGATGRLRWWMGFALIPFTSTAAALVRKGVVFQEGGLLRQAGDALAFDVAPVVRFLISPAVLIGALAVVAVFVFTPAFATHQLRRVWARSPLTRLLAHLSGALAVVGVFQPPLLDASYIVLVATFLVLLGEAIWTAPE